MRTPRHTLAGSLASVVGVALLVSTMLGSSMAAADPMQLPSPAVSSMGPMASGDGIGCDTPPPAPVPTAVATPGASALPTGSPPAPTSEPTPTPYLPLGVDASVWNGAVAWDRVAAVGVTFAYLKATQGTGLTDRRYARNVRGATGAGLAIGSYHFFDYRLDGRAQADRFVAVMRRNGALDGVLPPAVDVECFDRFGAADQADARAELRAFVDRVRESTGRQVMVYTGRWAWREVTGDADTFGDLPLWIACWNCGRPAMPASWTDWLVWQTGSMRVPGVGRMGESVFQGVDADVRPLRERVADRDPP